MLIRFAVENFASFKDMTEFNMMASKIVRHSDHVVSCNGKRVLKSAVLFGPNASGKSNFVKAIFVASQLVLYGLDRISVFKKYFRLDDACKDKPGVFQFDIFANGHFYSYGFAISYQSQSIVEEWLYNIDKQDDEKCVFLRSSTVPGVSRIRSDLSFSSSKEKMRFQLYKEDFFSNKMEQRFFLNDIAFRAPSDNPSYQAFADVFGWFTHLYVLFPNVKYMGIEELLENSDNKTKVENLLSYFDTGIKSLSRKPVDFDKIASKLGKSIDHILSALNGRKSYLCQLDSSLYEFVKEGDQINAYVIMTNHGNSSDLFEFGDESDGTKRLFSLIPIFRGATEESVIVIDELGRSLHTEATKEFIDRFFEISKGVKSQLIATTHDTNLLDLDFLRQDEIWFINRKKDCSSELYSLNAFNERFDKKIEKEYLLGRYGAVPNFRPKFLSDEKADTN